jgi:hypothetical protein
MALWEKADADLQAQKAAESALKSRRRDRDSLAERLGIAETSITSYRAQARKLAGDGGDDKAISTAEGRMRDAQDRVVTLTGALADIDVIITGIEREIDQIVDARCRRETSAAVTAMADELAEAQADFTKAAQRLEAAARQSGLLVPEGRAVAEFTLSAHTQLPPATAMVVGALHAHAKAVLAGGAPASLPRPAPAPKLAIVPPPVPMTNIFILQNLKYVNAEGATVCLGRSKRADLPAKLAEQALAEHKALPLSDPRCRALEYGATPYVPDEASCAWIGSPAKAKPAQKSTAAPIMSSHFEPLDRGPAYTVAIPRVEPVAMGSRNAEEDGQA